MNSGRRLTALALAAMLASSGAVSAVAASVTLRVGYFPNITHAHGVIGSHSSREGRGWFEERLGPDVTVQWFAFNAGPSAMEAIFAGSLDATYVGPNPALNAYNRSRGDEVRILAGATRGGAALIVRGDAGLKSAADFKGRRIASPQLGNTQDVAARAWLKKHGYRVTLTGGDVPVIPTANPDQLLLFQQRKVDAVWTVEPWVSRLELEAGGVALVEQPEAVTTVLVTSAKLLRTRPELAARLKAAHEELTAWIAAHPEEAKEEVRRGLSAESRREMPRHLVDHAWKRLHFTTEVSRAEFDALVAEAQSVGFLRDAQPLDRLFSGRP